MTNNVLHRVECAARRFSTADSTLLANRALLTRRDWKFVFPIELATQIVEGFSHSHRVLMAGDEVLARYATTYLDTPDLMFYNDHRRGRPRRQKVRFRDYVDRGVTMLEVKSKDGRGNTSKERIQRLEGQGVLDDAAQQFLNQHLRTRVDELVPSLNVDFRRLSLLSEHHQERVTFDFGLHFSNKTKDVRVSKFAIAEVKSASPAWCTQSLSIFRGFRIRETSMSKYVIGTSLVNQTVSSARHLAPLRRYLRGEKNAA